MIYVAKDEHDSVVCFPADFIEQALELGKTDYFPHAAELTLHEFDGSGEPDLKTLFTACGNRPPTLTWSKSDENTL